MKDESPLSPVALLSELNDKLDRMASAAAQGSLHMARAVRIIDAGHQLDARERMALRDEVDTLRKINMRLEKAVAHFQNRPPSMTVVQDIPTTREDDHTGIVYVGRDGVKRFKVPGIPTKYLLHVVIMLLAMAIAGGVALGRLGVKPSDVAKTAAQYVAP